MNAFALIRTSQSSGMRESPFPVNSGEQPELPIFRSLQRLDLGPRDRVLAELPYATFGTFDCPANHEAFGGVRELHCHHLVFPRTSLRIRSSGSAFLASPAVMTLYNPGEPFERQAVLESGDCSIYFMMHPRMFEFLRGQEAQTKGLSNRFLTPFVPGCAQATAAAYLLRADLLGNRLASQLEVEERALHALSLALDAAVRSWGPTSLGFRSARADRSRTRRGVEVVKEFLASSFKQNVGLEYLARLSKLSPSHLSRSFLRYTGVSLHRYVTNLRLQAGLEMINPEVSLTTVAMDLGFTHHSHFSFQFRRAFGMSPTEFCRAKWGR